MFCSTVAPQCRRLRNKPSRILQEQKSFEHGEATYTIAHFSNNPYHETNGYELLYNNLPIASAPLLTNVTYQPNGYTALRDALARFINDIGTKLAAMHESQRPEKVLVVVVSDGEENRSRYCTAEKLQEMVKHQSDRYAWNFIYMGTNQDAVLAGSSWGFEVGNCLNYSYATPGEYVIAKNALDCGTKKLRCSNEVKTSGFFA
jgi:hypothetical protein